MSRPKAQLGTRGLLRRCVPRAGGDGSTHYEHPRKDGTPRKMNQMLQFRDSSAMLLLSLVLGAASTSQLPRSQTWAECTASGGVPGANYPGGE